MRLIDAFAANMKLVEIYNDLTNEREKEIMRMAMDVLKNAPTIAPPPYDPLTLSELREIKGEPVWCGPYGWRICYMVSDFRGYPCLELGSGEAISLVGYGKSWVACRRKPEKKEDQ